MTNEKATDQFVRDLLREIGVDLAGVDPVGDAVMLRLPGEGLDDSIDGIGLVLLDLELELHRVSFFLQPSLFVVAARRVRAGWMPVFMLILALSRRRCRRPPSCQRAQTARLRRLRKKAPSVASRGCPG